MQMDFHDGIGRFAERFGIVLERSGVEGAVHREGGIAV
jgi:hypothetical protein